MAEFGGAGGWFTKRFALHGLDYQSVEGTKAGIEKICSHPIVESTRVHRYDLRSEIKLPQPILGAKFDMAMNTEVAEHIEIPFHSRLVETLTSFRPHLVLI